MVYWGKSHVVNYVNGKYMVNVFLMHTQLRWTIKSKSVYEVKVQRNKMGRIYIAVRHNLTKSAYF